MDGQKLVPPCCFHDLLFHDWSNVSLRPRKAASIPTFHRASSQRRWGHPVDACVGEQTHVACENAPDGGEVVQKIGPNNGFMKIMSYICGQTLVSS